MKKIICPHCKKELENIIEDRVQRAYYKISFLDTGEIDDWKFEDYDSIISSEYYCPECNKKIAKNDKELYKKFGIKS